MGMRPGSRLSTPKPKTSRSSVWSPRANPHARLSWSELDDTELVLQVSAGGRWELERTSDSVVFIEQVVMSVMAGRVEEVFGPDGPASL